jgi:hypothetical protein
MGWEGAVVLFFSGASLLGRSCKGTERALVLAWIESRGCTALLGSTMSRLDGQFEASTGLIVTWPCTSVLLLNMASMCVSSLSARVMVGFGTDGCGSIYILPSSHISST